ncbi:hypothetical protein [Laribacter hongkongensis]|uniref:hypothetical protein n=1 Tax=Laribacter hongkongensis TaxID=168471 RepID=UPI001B468892|nr:hypothetical protein [Laribacter hongkongensis]MBP8202382.1 hypothetical protein [Pseudomonas sp.]MCG9083957.1 hypothetical protein [Laribacter hongkongensis]
MTIKKTGNVDTASNLLKSHNITLNAASLHMLMEKAGFIEDAEYLSASGSGEIKKCKVLTNTGLKYGINEKSIYSAGTSIKLYGATFDDLIDEAIKYIR